MPKPKILLIECARADNSFLAKLIFLLKKEKLFYSVCSRANLSFDSFKDIDIAISIGGDGTYLRASHYNIKTPQLGINPFPETKEGFFTRSNINDAETAIKKLAKYDFKITNLLRLEAKINCRLVDELALNEFYIGPKKPFELFNYELKADNFPAEFQRSSGLLIGTPAGSYAWSKSAGGESLALDSKAFQVIVREPYVGKLNKPPQIVKKIFSTNSKISIKIRSYQGIIVADSVGTEYEFNENDVIEVMPSKNSLKLIDF
ncbi:MAG: hypothetical protein V1859_02985 [archaeon]